MKLIGNIGGFFYLATSIAALGSYKEKDRSTQGCGKAGRGKAGHRGSLQILVR